MQVRETTAEDVAEILAFVRAKADFDRGLGAFDGKLGTNEELIRRHLFGPRPIAFVLLACDPGPAVGFALYYFRYSSFRGRPSLWLDDLYVHPHARRQGAGHLLMTRLAEVAAAADCTHIAWTASVSNAIGMGFYRQLGATIVHQVGDSATLQIEPAALLGRAALCEPTDPGGPPLGIVACYKAEDNADDAVGNCPGTAHALTFGPGKVGRAFQFDGEGYVRVPDARSLNLPTVTVEAWVKSSAEIQGRYRYLAAKGIDTDASSYALYTGPSGGLFFYVSDQTRTAFLSPDAGKGVWDGNWHHVAGTYDGATVRLHVDGRQVGLGTPATLTINYNLPGGDDFAIGNYLTPGPWGFRGSIAEVSIYNRALTASEIEAIYASVVAWSQDVRDRATTSCYRKKQ